MVPVEVRFMSDRQGLCDLVTGRVTYRRFRELVLEKWYGWAPERGLQVFTDRASVEAALPELRDRLPSDPWQAGRAFVHRLLDPVALAAGAAGWIEMTPSAVLVAPTLLRLFPDARLIHALRDGRDVACSVIGLPWGPNELLEALDWWADKLQRGFEAVAAAEAVAPGRLLTLRLGNLAEADREGAYRRLISFAGLDDDPAMRAFFERAVTRDDAHVGRWQRDVPASLRPAFERRYEALVADLEANGWSLVDGSRAVALTAAGR
jgi:Sulfotransferase family